ncbi:MAG: hypothetical protein JW932_03010 [Deltaproteobacteria bacterium]|nr:hypothetical protein [Deltaproteobacteria bacterium]
MLVQKRFSGVRGSLFKFTRKSRHCLFPAPIAATNGIEDRHKEQTARIESILDANETGYWFDEKE